MCTIASIYVYRSDFIFNKFLVAMATDISYRYGCEMNNFWMWTCVAKWQKNEFHEFIEQEA